MTPEQKKLIVEDLRSGKHKQGIGYLHTKTSEGEFFCCLGRMCVVFGATVIEEIPIITSTRQEVVVLYSFGADFSRSKSYLPWDLAQVLGIDNEGQLKEPINSEDGRKYYRSLAELNDGRYTFEQIAQIIEEQF